ncbi:MAG: hypothetical protein K6A65_05845 [Succinivibrionaceae bacterium]|nr:hypothetical protein [Succinivibrionaceae bacterium]
MALAPVYIISSDEPLLKNDRHDEVMRDARAALPAAQLVILTTSDFSGSGKQGLAALESELLDPGLFGGDRIIKLYFKDLDSTAVAALEMLALRMRDGICAIVDFPRLNTAYFKEAPRDPKELQENAPPKGKGGKAGRAISAETRKKRAIAYIKFIGGEANGPLFPPDPGALPEFLARRARKLGMGITRDAAEYLAACFSGNLCAADQALRVMALSPHDGPVGAAEIEREITEDSRATPYEVQDAILQGDTGRALAIIGTVATGRDQALGLGLMLQCLDNVQGAIRDALAKDLGRAAWAEKTAFCMAHGLKVPAVQRALIGALGWVTPRHLQRLCSHLARADAAYRRFDLPECARELRALATSVGDPRAPDLHRLS